MTNSQSLKAIADNIEQFWLPLAEKVGADLTKPAAHDAMALREIAREMEENNGRT